MREDRPALVRHVYVPVMVFHKLIENMSTFTPGMFALQSVKYNSRRSRPAGSFTGRSIARPPRSSHLRLLTSPAG